MAEAVKISEEKATRGIQGAQEGEKKFGKAKDAPYFEEMTSEMLRDVVGSIARQNGDPRSLHQRSVDQKMELIKSELKKVIDPTSKRKIGEMCDKCGNKHKEAQMKTVRAVIEPMAKELVQDAKNNRGQSQGDNDPNKGRGGKTTAKTTQSANEEKWR